MAASLLVASGVAVGRLTATAQALPGDTVSVSDSSALRAGEDTAARTEGGTTAGDTSPVSAAQPDSSSGGPWLVLANVLAAVGASLGILALLKARESLRIATSAARNPQPRIVTAPVSPPPRPAVDASEFQALRDRVVELEGGIEALRVVRHPQAASGLEPASSTAVAPAAVMAPNGDVISGMLARDDQVRVSTASRPMVEIRWATGKPTAEVWINPDYKFADLTADYLVSAFDLDEQGPGSYETIVPATIEWGPGASSGRVRERGRARPVGR